MAAWVLLVCGCLIAAQGIWDVNARPTQYSRPRRFGWGKLLMGVGLALEPLPRLAGCSSGMAVVVATIGMGVVASGVALQLLRRVRRRSSGI